MQSSPSTLQQDEENALLSSIRHKAGFSHLPYEMPLMSTRNIAVGQVGSIFGKNHQAALIQKASVVESNEFSFTLQYNVDKEDLVEIPLGSEIKFAFARQADGVYGVLTRVIADEGAGTLICTHSLNIRRNQLRQYVRIEMAGSVKMRLIKAADPQHSEIREGQAAEARIADISGGGISFVFDKSFKVGDIISTAFSMPGGTFAGIQCKILRISLVEARDATRYRHHGLFLNIEPRKRDTIVKYVFEKQRQQSQWR
jgi:c-di-GMP-binding flagellar brake protein YcgR